MSRSARARDAALHARGLPVLALPVFGLPVLALLVCVLLALTPSPASAQEAFCGAGARGTLPSPDDAWHRGPELADPALHWGLARRPSDGLVAPPRPDSAPNRNLSLRLAEVTLDARRSSDYARQLDDGALWLGRGVSGGLTPRIIARYRGFTAVAAPTALYQENLPFQTPDTVIAGRSRFAYPWQPAGIDQVMRFGTDPEGRVDPGPSVLRFDTPDVGVGVSNENLWWSAGERNALVLGSGAPGFPHYFVGTNRPARLGPVRLCGEAVVGRLTESEWFDTDGGNDTRAFSGVSLTLGTTALPDLRLGLHYATVHVVPLEGYGVANDLPLWSVFFAPSVDGQTLGQGAVGSLTMEWREREALFRAYLELARSRPVENVFDLLESGEGATGVTAGVEKLLDRAGVDVRIVAEISDLKNSDDAVFPDAPPGFYTYPEVPQGFTHRGQLLGAVIGPGSDSQYLGVDLLWPRVMGRIWVERVRRDDDAYFASRARNYGFHGHDVELTVGAGQAFRHGEWTLSWEAAGGFRRNRLFLGLDKTDLRPEDFENLLEENNLYLRLRLDWRPGSRRSTTSSSASTNRSTQASSVNDSR